VAFGSSSDTTPGNSNSSSFGIRGPRLLAFGRHHRRTPGQNWRGT
jgi:hypothetical protein